MHGSVASRSEVDASSLVIYARSVTSNEVAKSSCHLDHKNPKLNFLFGLGFFVCVDCSHLFSTQVESGSPSEQSREVLAH